MQVKDLLSKKKTWIVKYYCLFLVVFLCFQNAQAAYLKNNPITKIQPDGTEIHCFVSGDEYFNYLHDANGYTIMQHPETGYYVYADKRDGKLVATNYVVGISDPASKGLAPYALISSEEWMARRKVREDKEQYPNDRGWELNHGILNNIAIFIRFAGDSEFTQAFSSIDDMFNDETQNANSLINYFKSVSYNTLTIPTHFYPGHNDETIISYQDIYPRSYYEPYNATTNPNGYTDSGIEREAGLVERAINYVTANYPISNDLEIDHDNDGMVDNVCLIIISSGVGDLLRLHHDSLDDRTVTINGKQVHDYNILLADDVDVDNFITNACHEMNHTLGAPDLYHEFGTDPDPVASWDLMCTNTTIPQHCGAWMKYLYGGWLDEIPEITQAGTYTLNPISSSTPVNVAYKITTEDPHQFYILEYRNKNTPFESDLPGSGLLIYRINSQFRGNFNYNPSTNRYDEVYIFRPSGSFLNGGGIFNAHFSSDVSRTEFGPSTNPFPCFSDGTADNSFRIYDISSAGSTISFKYEPLYYITASSDPVVGGTVSGAGCYGANAECTLTATPNTHYTFSNWTKDGTVVSTNPTYTFTVTENGQYVANFTAIPQYTITALANPTIGGTVTGSGIYDMNSVCTLTATPNTRYSFTNWTKDGVQVSASPTYTFTVTDDGEYSANFSALTPHAITLNQPENDQGTISASSTTAYIGDIITLTYNKPYMSFDVWAVSEWIVVDANNNPITVTNEQFSMPDKDVTVSAILTLLQSDCVDGLCYYFNDYTMTAEITGAGFEGNPYYPNLIIPSSVVYQSNTYEVTSIREEAFDNRSDLTGSLIIPNFVTKIGKRAFYNCSGFTGDLVMPNSVAIIGEEAFYGCSGLTGSLSIPNTVTRIGYDAFYGCSGFSTVYYNAENCADADKLHDFASPAYYVGGFRGCAGSLIIGNNVERIPAGMFKSSGFTGNLTIPNSVTTIGEEAFRACSGFIGNLTIPNSVTTIGEEAFRACSGFTGDLTIGNSVTTIGEEAFSYCIGFTGTLTIGYFVTTIGDSAFSNCSGFSTIYYNPTHCADLDFNYNYDYNDPFDGCTGSLVIGDNVERVPAGMFGSGGFTGNLTIGESVTSIGGGAFGGCSFSTVYYNSINCADFEYYHSAFYNCVGSLVIGDNVERIPAYIFRGGGFTNSLTIPNSVITIGSGAFEECSNLTNLNIGNSVTEIGVVAFKDCSGFTGNLTIGNSVTTIGSWAFGNCGGFTSISIGNSLTEVGHDAFYECNGFTGVYYSGDIAQWCDISFESWSANPLNYAHNLYIDNNLVINLVIPQNVTEIKPNAFVGCSSFTGDLIIPSSVTTIGENAFSNCRGFTGNLTIGSSVNSIGDYAFGACTGFSSLTIGNSVTIIGGAAFRYCSGFSGDLVIPNSVTTIGIYAFQNCSGFTGSLTIGSSVTSIGEYAFLNCSRINAIRIRCSVPPIVSYNSFSSVNKTIPVFVPCGTREAYAVANYWSEFSAINESPYDFFVTQNDPYGGRVSVVQYANCEDNHCTILAQNNIGYNFTGWFINNYFINGLSYYNYPLTSNTTIEARFERNPNHFIAVTDNSTNTWSDPGTWDTGEVPSSTSTVAIYKNVIVDVDAEVSQVGIYDNGTITILPDMELTVTDELESNTVRSIVIEDGGQLYHANDGALATVKKTIEPYTADADGWNLISFPLTGNGNVVSVGNMLDNEYDLYAYDEPTHYWINQKEENNDFTALEAGKGYLYANKGTGIGATGTKIGEGTSTIGYTPFYTYYENSIAENLFLASELEAAGLPTTALGGICWYATNQTGYRQCNISIWMANVNEEALTFFSHNVSGMTLVYTGNMTPVVGWNEFVFNENSFAWDGTSNVLVCVQRNNGEWNSTVYWQAHDPGFWATSYNYQDGSAYDMTMETYSMNVSSTLRPNTVFQTLEQVGQFEYYGSITMSFAGEVENDTMMVTLPLSFTETARNLKGFNLIGNPFVHNVTSYASTNVAEGCFRLNEAKDNLIVSEINETHPLKPAEGFFVKATAEGASVTFTSDRLRGEAERKGLVNLELMKNGRIIDRLIVKREGEPLEKLTLKGNGTRLYAVQDHQEMAIVPCEGNEQAVCFKAAKNGTYTISVSTDDAELDYLHLVDNLTGADVDLLALRQAQGLASYTFVAKTTDYASRFRLVFSPIFGDENGDNAPFAYIRNGEIILIGGDTSTASLKIIDVTGRVLVDTDVACNVSTSGIAPGVYELHLIQGPNKMTQKIVIP